MLGYVWLIPLLPLLGALVNATIGRWLPRWLVAILACLAVGSSFAIALGVFGTLLSLPPALADGSNGREWTIPLFTWIVAGKLIVEAGLLLDQLSIVMTLVVTGVSTLIHVYSASYMQGDEYYKRYFTWLNLFVFMMLVLVLSDNLLTMFIGWEGVGLCSYLLIGYWFERESAADAAKKAFIVNRVGDFGLILGLLLLFASLGTLAFDEVFPAAKTLLPTTATAISLLLFLGATGKSAQIPLFIWLPDAMEGPTPVSALIHAATMVTAGVYLVARCWPLFEQSLSALNWVAWIGAITALLAASVAAVEKDFKRILAYSTISQLGIMFTALGVGGYAAALFLLTTHAFFKALLFLCAGSVMHALAGEANIFKMGGLRHRMPWTFGTFMAAALSLAGVPLLAGFFSKDEILHLAFVRGHLGLGLVTLTTAGLSAFYSFRLMYLVFYGKSHRSKKAEAQIHEATPVMLAPMVILGVLAVIGGYIGLPAAFGVGNAIDLFLSPVFAGSARAGAGHVGPLSEWLVIVASVVATAIAFAVAYWLYVRRPGAAESWTKAAGWLYELVENKYYVDQAYQSALVTPLRRLGGVLSDVVERRGIDGAVLGLGELVGLVGDGLRRLQTGLLRNYGLALLLGAVAILAYWVARSILGL